MNKKQFNKENAITSLVERNTFRFNKEEVKNLKKILPACRQYVKMYEISKAKKLNFEMNKMRTSVWKRCSIGYHTNWLIWWAICFHRMWFHFRLEQRNCILKFFCIDRPCKNEVNQNSPNRWIEVTVYEKGA